MLSGLLRRWPFAHGKGVLAGVFSPIWERREFLFAAEPNVFVPAELNDYMVY